MIRIFKRFESVFRLKNKQAQEITIPNGTIRSIACGLTHTLVATDEDTFAFGSNFYGQAGYFPQLNSNLTFFMDDEYVDQPSGLGKVFSSIHSLDYHNLALEEDKLMTWGGGCLGRGSELFEGQPTNVPIERPTMIGGRNNTSFVVTQDNEVYTWGYLGCFKEEYKILKPAKIDVGHWDRLDAVDQTRHMITLAGETEAGLQIQIYGSQPQDEIKTFNYSPYLKNCEIFKMDLSLPLLSKWSIQEPVKKLAILSSGLLLLQNKTLKVTDFNGKTIKQIDGIRLLSFGDHAVHMVNEQDEILEWMAQPVLSTTENSIWPWQDPKETIVEPGKSLWNVILEQDPELVAKMPVKTLATGWDECYFSLRS
ncbi:regulator of chromosome condensation 1/beta-lactamase-inhibitor protein II, partial [Gorgonomyces haynaldii]